MKKKGFTLVELLAVVIILAIVAFIAVPTIMDSIENARRNAFKDSVYQAFQEIQYYLVQHNLDEIPEEGIEVKDIEFKNNTFVSGRLILGQSGNVKASNVSDGRYCAIGEKDALEIYDGDCDLSVPTCELKTKEEMGANGWYGINPIVIMNTMPVKAGPLNYGIGLRENYDYTIKGVGKIGTAEYQTIGDVPVTVYCYIRNISEVRGKNEININIDKTAPTNADFSYSTSGKSITVIASGIDSESGIARYQFSNDNGTTWTDIQSSNTYTFTQLDPIIYTVKVRVYNGTYVESKKENNLYKESEVKQISVAELEVPTYTHTPTGWTAGNVDVTVQFSKDGVYLIKPSLDVISDIDAISCSSVYNGSYTCEGGKTKNLQAGIWYQVDSSPTLTFSDNGSVIAQVSDGLNYKSASAFNVSNIDRVKPVATIKEANVSAGIEGWYKSVSLQVEKQSSGPSGIASWYYCITSDETCNPTTEVSIGTNISIGNNTVGQKVCGKIISKTGIESDIACGLNYKVDNIPPTAEFSMTGVTCKDNNEIHPDKAGTTWTLSGTSNVTKTYECQDKAGNTYLATRTYKYNSCKTGSNTCQGGYESSVWSDCATGSNTCQGGYNQEYRECATGSNTCQGGYNQEYRECATGSNTCQGGYSCTSGTLVNGNQCRTTSTRSYTKTQKTQSAGTTAAACQNFCSKYGSSNCQKEATGTYYVCHYTVNSCPSGYNDNGSLCWKYNYTSATYNACLTGSNTCQPGYVNTTWNACKTGSNTCKGGYVNTTWNSCIRGSNTCQGGYVNSNWNACKTGSNTCQGGFE